MKNSLILIAAVVLLAMSGRVAAQWATIAPVVAFAPLQQADGSRTWRLVVEARRYDDDTIMLTLMSEMAKAHWCESGWEITSRALAMKNVIIEGRCKTH